MDEYIRPGLNKMEAPFHFIHFLMDCCAWCCKARAVVAPAAPSHWNRNRKSFPQHDARGEIGRGAGINTNIVLDIIPTHEKIGILHGMERSFPEAFVEQVNKMNIKGITAEPVTVDIVQQAKATDYAVIIDRISQDVPFYRAYLKNAASTGTAVLNNPFWWSADEKFLTMHWRWRLVCPFPKRLYFHRTNAQRIPLKVLSAIWNFRWVGIRFLKHRLASFTWSHTQVAVGNTFTSWTTPQNFWSL